MDVPVDPRPEYMRVHLKFSAKSNRMIAYPVGNQISSRLNSFIGANALLHLPSKEEHQNSFKTGEFFDAYLLNYSGIEFEE